MELSPQQCFEVVRSRDARFDGRVFIGVTSTGVYCRPICPARLPRQENMVFFVCASAAEQAGFRACKKCRPDAAPGSPAWQRTGASVARALRLIESGELERLGVDGVAERVGMTARHLRRLFTHHVGASPRRVAHARGGSLRVQVPVRPPYDWSRLAAFLAPRMITGVESISGGIYRRRVVSGIVEVRPLTATALEVTIPPGASALDVVGRVRRMFDASAEPRAIAAHLARDPVLTARVERRPGLRLAGGWDGFEIAVRAILGQQITVRGASTLCARLIERFGTAAGDGDLGRLFPSPEQLADADIAAIGMPRRRGDAIRSLARATVDGTVRFDGSVDGAGLTAALTALPGIGPWTAQYVAMRGCAEPDAFPAGDLGLCRALSLTPRQLAARAEAWRPWRAYAAMHLWEEI